MEDRFRELFFFWRQNKTNTVVSSCRHRRNDARASVIFFSIGVCVCMCMEISANKSNVYCFYDIKIQTLCVLFNCSCVFGAHVRVQPIYTKKANHQKSVIIELTLCRESRLFPCSCRIVCCDFFFSFYIGETVLWFIYMNVFGALRYVNRFWISWFFIWRYLHEYFYSKFTIPIHTCA